LGGVGFNEGVTMGQQVWIQTKSVLITIGFVAVASYLILKLVDIVMGLRVSDEQETEGLDIALHDERGYNQAHHQ
jgi:ammonium transporter, Amt family